MSRSFLFFFACIMLSGSWWQDGLAVELHEAARKGDEARVKELLQGGANVDHLGGSGSSALYEAAKWGHPRTVVTLLGAGADPYIAAKGPYGSAGTPIHVAAKQGHAEVVRLLLDAGVDPNLPDDGTGPPLHLAIRRGHADVAELLRSAGARSVSAESVDELLHGADIEMGRKMSNACRACHDLSADRSMTNMQGPALWDIVGRGKAAIVGYEYSDALVDAGGVWSYDDLNSFVANPRAFVPGTKMDGFLGIASAQHRAALILYLRTLSVEPLPLP